MGKTHRHIISQAVRSERELERPDLKCKHKVIDRKANPVGRYGNNRKMWATLKHIERRKELKRHYEAENKLQKIAE